MTEHFIEKIRKTILDRTGIAVRAFIDSTDGIKILEVSPSCMHKSEGFCFRMTFEHNKSVVEFIVGNFAKHIVSKMGISSYEDKYKFSIYASQLKKHGVKLTMQVNGAMLDPLTASAWPCDWREIRIHGRMFTVSSDGNLILERQLIENLLVTFIQMVVSIIPVELNLLNDSEKQEGAEILGLSKRYERSPLNREACIILKGCKCLICGFSYSDKYGEIGDGFIEVHHTTPVSEFGGSRILDINKDLIPVCANCHRMLHKRNPPFSVEEMKVFLSK